MIIDVGFFMNTLIHHSFFFMKEIDSLFFFCFQMIHFKYEMFKKIAKYVLINYEEL